MTSRSSTALLVCIAAGAGATTVGSRPAVAADPDPDPDPHMELLASAGARLRAEARDPAAASALAVLAALDEDVPPAALETAVRGGLGPGGHPLVAAQAAMLAAHLAAERGDRQAAEALRGTLGLIERFAVLGPFGDGRASYARPFPPEREAATPEAGRSYPGKSHEVAWRAADGAVRDGALYLDGLLRPADQAVAYVAAYVHSDRARPAALRIGSAGPIKVWVGGGLVLARDVVRAPALDQDAAGVRLARGWNRILIKTVITEGAWRLYARLTEPSGAPLGAGVTTDWDPARPPATGRARQGAGPPVSTLDGLLATRARTARGPTAADAWLDYARVAAWLEARDRDERAPAAAFARAIALRPSLAALLGAADAAAEDDERRRFLERAEELPDLTPAWRALLEARLGLLARTERREARAAAALEGALALEPRCWTASLAVAEEAAEAGLPLAALDRLEHLGPDARALPRVRRALARLYESAGRRADAERALDELARDRQADVDILHEQSGWARARGDGATAAERLAAAVALRPDLPSLAIELARLEEGTGAPERALATLSALAARVPDDPQTLIALGKLLRRTGRTAEALARLRAALALRPQDPELKRTIDHLAAGGAGDGTAADELARRYADDARALVPAPRGPAAPADTAVVLLDRRVVRVHRNGLARTFAQRVVAILTERGAEENKEFAVHYAPGAEEVDIRQARVYRRDAGGQIQTLEATDRSDEDLSEPWYGLYYDNRAEVIRFEGLRPGDVIEIQYLVDDVGNENQLGDYFGDLQYLAESIPKRRWDYTLIAPVGRPIHANVPHTGGLERSVAVEGDDRVYRFAAANVAKLDAEPAMPGYTEVAPYLHLSTTASWDEVGALYWRLVEEQLAADDDIRSAARGLVKHGMTDAEKVRAVYDFVVTNTRYVGLEFGIHGYKPYKVTQVLARRFGDCKDKAALMIALLREVGVPGELVLVRTRRGGRLDTQPASLAIFDHAIVYVPKLDRYLDGTAEFAGLGELPSQDQGVTVLRVGPRGARLTETPVLPSSDNRVERRWRVTVEASGDARVDEQLTIRGQAAPNWREHYQSAGERAERYGRVWTGRFAGARLVAVDFPTVGERNAPVEVRADVVVPRLGRGAAAGGLELPLTGRDADFVRTYARLSVRREDLLLAYPWRHDEDLAYRVPKGWHLEAAAPATRVVESPFGRFRLEVGVEGDVVRVRSTLDVTRARIAPADYPRFRAFLAEIDAALDGRLAIVPPGAGT
jgi:transglutaminase-like putative cysteine protease/tetratricopeptide (TPR) repeat protein